MNELIKITETELGEVSSARDLHQVLEVKTEFSQWCKRMFEYGFIENEDYALVKIGEGSVHNKTDYALTVDTAKEISMLQRTEKGKEVRKYYIEVEKLKNKVFVPKTRLELAKENLALIEELESKDALLLKQAPKIQAFEKVIDNSATFTVDSLSDAVDIGRTTLFSILKN